MLHIRKEQLDAPAREMYARFDDDAHAHARRYFPAQCDVLGKEGAIEPVLIPLPRPPAPGTAPSEAMAPVLDEFETETESKFPPAIGYGHRVFLRTAPGVAAFSPAGERLWHAQIPGGIAGLSVTPHSRLIVAAGAAIQQVDAKGNASRPASLGALAATAPVFTASGEILVGAETGVLCLVAR